MAKINSESQTRKKSMKLRSDLPREQPQKRHRTGVSGNVDEIYSHVRTNARAKTEFPR